ncbi:MAG: ribonuclease HII [Oscillospiraceae bacterium]|nr:ribonuclease HII [Oscillospiraceae bacterium]MBQ2602299.1 ribonuclease HII [Oscillospiraceae bacterium]
MRKGEADLWAYERELKEEGKKLIAGVDEAGRGPLAGPVCAAACVLPFGLEIDGLNDSKKLSEKQRERLYGIITEKAEAWAVGFASPEEIDEVNILNATYLAMNRAVKALGLEPDISIVDGNRSEGLRFSNIAVVGGDGKSASVAAASIIAKVTRDRLMLSLAEKYPQYAFEKHKGYPTALHYERLREYGPCEIHRKSFLKKMH